MAAPTLTARVNPTGIMLENGHGTIFAFSRKPNINFEEKDTSPMGWDGGDPIDITTQYNTRVRQKAPRRLIDSTNPTAQVAYDPKCIDEVRELINQRGSITEYLPDGSTLTYYGYLKSFKRGSHVEGTQPTADIEIVVTNTDPDTGAEELPVLVEVPGT